MLPFIGVWNRYIPRFLDYGYDEIWVCAHLDNDDLVQLGIIEKADRYSLSIFLL